MHRHILAVSTGAQTGRLKPAELKEVASCIRVLQGVKAVRKVHTAGGLPTLDSLLEAAGKFPELQEAISSLGGK